MQYIHRYLFIYPWICLFIYIYVISSRFRTSSQPPGHGFCGDRPRDPGILVHFGGVQRWSYNDSDGGIAAILKYFSQATSHVPFAWKNNNGVSLLVHPPDHFKSLLVGKCSKKGKPLPWTRLATFKMHPGLPVKACRADIDAAMLCW